MPERIRSRLLRHRMLTCLPPRATRCPDPAHYRSRQQERLEVYQKLTSVQPALSEGSERIGDLTMRNRREQNRAGAGTNRAVVGVTGGLTSTGTMKAAGALDNAVSAADNGIAAGGLVGIGGCHD